MKQSLPRRLLRIYQMASMGKPIVRLCLTHPDHQYRYVALSHCWAKSDPIKTTRQNLHERIYNIPLDTMPEVFRNTIALSLKLRINYVWIDSLCIIQGDKEDWLMESVKMAAIYGNAHVVFAAHGPNLGLNKEINTCTEPVSTQVPSHPGENAIFVRQTIDHESLVHPPDDPDSWFGRAWCFQERLFASRILHFGGDWEEVFFECNVHFRCECGGVKDLFQADSSSSWSHRKASFAQIMEKSQVRDPGHLIEEKWRVYITLCEVFTSQGLTYPQDTLLALSSLVERVSPHLGRYLGGIWEHNLLIGLQWESLDGQQSHRQTAYIAPSFSWASRTGPTVWYIADELLTPSIDKCEFAQILDMHCQTSPEIPYGQVTDGFISVRGYTTIMHFEDADGCYIQGRVKLFKDGTTSTNLTKSPSDTTRRNEDCCYVCMDTVEDIANVRGQATTCLDIMRDKNGSGFLSALILIPVGDKKGVYRRVGFSTMTRDFFEEAQLTDVTIV